MSDNTKQYPKELFEPAQTSHLNSEKIEKPSLNYWQDAWLRVKKNKGAIFSLFLLVFLMIMSVCWSIHEQVHV